MLSTVRMALIGFLALLAAHALAYFLAGVLPNAAVIALGFESAKPDVVSAFAQAHQVRPYLKTLLDLADGNLGRTLDGVPVAREIAAAMEATMPRLGLAFMGVAFVALLSSLVVALQRQTAKRVTAFLAFLPPYLPAFLIFDMLLAAGITQLSQLGYTAAWWGIVVAMMIPPAAMVAGQAAAVAARNAESDHARTLLALGATPQQVRLRLLHNVTAEITPTLEKVLTGLFSTLLFAEPIFGLPGLGTTAVRAIRRTDVDLLLALVLIFAVVVNVARMVSTAIRKRYGME